MTIEPQQLPKKRRPYTHKIRDAVIQAAETHPMDQRWIKYPGQDRWKNKKTVGTVAARINSGSQWGPGFEAEVRDWVLYVRFVG